MEKYIESPNNKLIKLVYKVANDKKYRDSTNLFIGEGYRVVKQLIDSTIKPQNIIVSKDCKYINDLKQAIVVPNHIFNKISTLSNSDGVIGLFVKPKLEFNLQKNGKYIILNKLQNPNNIGSIIRTCIGLNISGIFITNDSVDLFHPTIIRASAGSLFNIPIKFSTSLIDVIHQLKNNGYKCYATTLNKNAKIIDDVNFGSSVAVLFGNEGNGLDAKDIKLCDEQIYIGISNKVESLNVATSVAIVAYKITR
jgi:TrmH family RNA methyltransferase